MKKTLLLLLVTSVQSLLSQAQLDTVMDYSSTLRLDGKKFQFLMSSQNYGTNYAVYARYYTSPDKKNGQEHDRKRRVLDSAHFKLVNYKAKVFLDIDSIIVDSVNFDKIEIADFDKAYIEKYKFKILVRAKEYSNEDFYKFIPDSEKKVVLNKNKTLISERYLLPMFIEDVVGPDDECPEKFCFKLNSGNLDLSYKIKAHNGRTLDSEFYHMDGSEHLIRKENYDEFPIDFDGSELRKKGKKDYFIPGPRCKTSFNLMM